MTSDIPESVEVEAPGSNGWSVIWLHGLGADGHDFEPLVPELRLPPDHGIRFVFPHAPRRPVTIHDGVPTRAWYDIVDPDLTMAEDKKGIRGSIEIVRGLIARERDQHGIAAERIVLAGFSQGGAIALATGLRHGERLGGIAALSAYLPMAATLADDMDPANHDTPIFQGHGSHDPIVPEQQAASSRDAIAALRPAPEWHTYPVEHAVCAEEIEDLRAWLTGTVGAG